MNKYNKITPELLNKLTDLLGKRYISTDANKLEIYKTDEEANTNYHKLPEVVVFPENAQQISEIIKLANEYYVPVTPRGAGTGLACGAIPIYGGIVLVMDRLNKIIELNEDGRYVIAQAGVRTLDIQNAAKIQGLLYAGDPCSADSCQIGGNVATNAGGNRAVKYGTTRDQIYAIQVVTPMGDIVEFGARTEKNSTGYAIDKLFIGSEGTLGIITQVTLKLRPLPPYKFDLLAIFDNIKKALELPKMIAKSGMNPTSIEYMDNTAIKSCIRYMKIDLPHGKDGSVYDIITIDGFNEDELNGKMEELAELCEAAGAIDVLIADEERIWKARRLFAEAARADSMVYYAEDIVVPVNKIFDLMENLPTIEAKHGIVTTTAAHIGDGNIHVNALKGDISEDNWDDKLAEFHKELYGLVYQLGGRLSGEHGIGYKKVKEMEMFTDPKVLNIMRAFKKAIDPKYILNPGKIFRN